MYTICIYIYIICLSPVLKTFILVYAMHVCSKIGKLKQDFFELYILDDIIIDSQTHTHTHICSMNNHPYKYSCMSTGRLRARERVYIYYVYTSLECIIANKHAAMQIHSNGGGR